MKKEEYETLLPVIAIIQQYMEAIDNSLKSEHEMPALTLIYSLIDALSWLNSTKNKTNVRDRFILWVEKFLLKSNNLKCSALDLYAARCAIIHTLTSDSYLSESGKAKRAIYITDYANKKYLGNYEIDVDKFFIININLLQKELIRAVLDFAKFIDSSELIRNQVIIKAKGFYFLLPK